MHLGSEKEMSLWGTSGGRGVQIKMAKWVSLR